MTNPYYNNTNTLLSGALARANAVEAKFDAVATGFDLAAEAIDEVVGGAAASASAAAASAVAAAGSATSASGSATAASGSASAAASSASSALASAIAAAATFDDFDDRYLGAKTANPALDNDGDPLETGALYFNTVSAVMRVYDGANWQNVVAGVNTFNGRAGAVTLQASDLNGLVSVAGGETATSPAAYATVTLTSTSTVHQTVTPQGWGCSVTLPNATTMLELGKAFVVSNASLQYPLAVYNTAGTLVAAVNPGEAVEVVLLDKAVSAGQWAGLNSACAATVDQKKFLVASTRYSLGVIRVSSTLFILVEADSVSNLAYIRVVSISSGQITVGTNTLLSASTIGGSLLSAVLADGRVMIDTNAYTVAVSISGVTPTIGASVARSASFDQVEAIVAYSQGVFQIGSKSTATIGFVCRIMSIGASGVTITGGTVQTSALASQPSTSAYQLDSDTLLTAITTFSSGTPTEFRGFKAVRSGTSVTLTASANAPSARTADGNLSPQTVALGSSRFLAAYRDTSGNRRYAVLDANTPAWGTSATNSTTDGNFGTSQLKPITGGYAFAFASTSVLGRIEAMSVSGSTITLGATATFAPASVNTVSLSASGTSGIVTFDNGNYPYAVKFSGVTTTAGPALTGGLQSGALESGGSLHLLFQGNNIQRLQKVSVDSSGLIVVEAQAAVGNAAPAPVLSGGVVLGAGFDGIYKTGGKTAFYPIFGFSISMKSAETTSFLAYTTGEVALIRSVA